MHILLLQQVQCGLWLRQPDLAGGRRAAVQGVPQAAMGGVQLAQDLPSHIRARTRLGSAEGALQELQVPVRQRRVPARGVLAGARRQGADGAGAHRGPLGRRVVCVRRVVVSQEPGDRGPTGAGADAGALVVRGRRLFDHHVHPRAVRTRRRRQRGGRLQARRRTASPRLHRLAARRSSRVRCASRTVEEVTSATAKAFSLIRSSCTRRRSK